MVSLLAFSIRNTQVKTFPDHGHGHNHAHAHTPTSQADESDPTAAGYYNQYYDPAYAQNYYQKYDMANTKRKGQVYLHYFSYQDPNYQLGYRYSDYSDDELVEKQAGGPTPADFIPFIASLSLPLTAALVTFVSIILVYIWQHNVKPLYTSTRFQRMNRIPVHQVK